MDITFTLQSVTDGSFLTSQAANTTVYISKDGGSYAATTNAVVEIGRGSYKVTLTSAEAAFQTLLYAPVCTGAQSNILIKEADPVMPTVPTASDNAQAVWGAQTKEVMIATAQADTFATAAALSTVGDNVSAVKAKTDNLPASPAAVGSEMALTSAYDAAKTASQFNPSTDAVTIATAQASTLATAAAQEAQTAALETLAASILHWAATASTLTLYDSTGDAIANYALTRDSSGNITAIAPAVEGN